MMIPQETLKHQKQSDTDMVKKKTKKTKIQYYIQNTTWKTNDRAIRIPSITRGTPEG